MRTFGLTKRAWSARLEHYLLAVVAVLMVTLIRMGLLRLGAYDTPFLLFPLAVLVSGWWGGFGPGLLATVLSLAVVDVMFLGQDATLADREMGAILPLTVFLLEGAFISWLCGSNRTALSSLEEARSTLEHRVEERTRELQVKAEQLERSNRELQDFASVASHDLQEPLRKIQAFGDRLKVRCSEALSVEGQDYLQRMQNAAQRMQTLINDLLTFSRVSTRAQPYQAVNLEQVASDVIEDLETRIEQTGATVDLGNLPTIDADPLQMRQLFQNLLSNALKFRKPDVPPFVRIEGQVRPNDSELTRSENGAVCQILVKDNGIGFEEKYLDRIFNIFQRLHGRAVYEGTGVGLAVCRKIVERHGGSITAHSRPGEGATFIVSLPARQKTEEQT